MTDESLKTVLAAMPLLYLFFIVIEAIASAWLNRDIYHRGETIATFVIVSLTVILNLSLRGVYLAFYAWLNQFQLFHIENALIYWTVLVVTQDFLFYILHCVDHFCRLFWAVHVTHHNSTDFNFGIGVRPSVFQPLYRFFYMSPLALMGFSGVDIMMTYAITQIYGFFVHTQYVGNLPKWYSLIFVTPAHHQVHHGSNEQYLDKNMGMFLIIWDRIFGTFQDRLDEQPVRYGLTKNPINRSPLNMVFHEFFSLIEDVKSASSWGDKLRFIFYPPGWKPETVAKTQTQQEPVYGTSEPA